MKRKKVKRILIIISIIIVFLGIIVGNNISNDLINNIPKENIYIDGSNFSGLVEIGGVIGSKILGTLIIFLSVLIDIIIWIMYGCVLLILKIINNKKNNISKAQNDKY